MLFLNLIISVDFSFEVVISKKDIEKFIKKHNRSDKELYTDLLAHLLHSKMDNIGKHIFMVSQRGSTTRQATLQMALTKAATILQSNEENKIEKGEIILDVVKE